MNIAIIGANGFFGYSFLDYFYKNRKLNKSNLFLYSRKFSKKIINKYNSKNITFENINNFNKYDFKFDFIIYAAISHNYKNDYKFLTNFTKNIKKKINQKFIFLSSGAVEKKGKFSKREKSYKIFKIKCERYLRQFFKEKILILRLYSFIGPWIPLKKNFIVGNIIYALIKDKKFIFNSDKKNIYRSFLYDQKMVEEVINILRKKKIKKIYKIGSKEDIELRDCLKLLKQKMKLKISFKYDQSSLNYDDKYILNDKLKIRRINYINFFKYIRKSIKRLNKENI